MGEMKIQELDNGVFIVEELDISHVTIEDDAPVDNLFSERQMRLLVESLYTSWSGPTDGRNFIAMANVSVFAHLHEPPLVSDVLVSTDVPLPPDLSKKQHCTYFVWEYGKPPDIVIEIVSNKVGDELGDKLLDYARMGVGYYVVYDPDKYITQEPLRIFTRQGVHFAEVQETWLAPLELGVMLWEGEYEGTHSVWLRWRDQQGNMLATGREALAEQSLLLLAESQRAAALAATARWASIRRPPTEQHGMPGRNQRTEGDNRVSPLATHSSPLISGYA